jgi:hypothetical protein
LVTLNTIKLGNLRKMPLAVRKGIPARIYSSRNSTAAKRESLRVEWVQNNIERQDLADQTMLAGGLRENEGDWSITVVFETDEVR